MAYDWSSLSEAPERKYDWKALPESTNHDWSSLAPETRPVDGLQATDSQAVQEPSLISKFTQALKMGAGPLASVNPDQAIDTGAKVMSAVEDNPIARKLASIPTPASTFLNPAFNAVRGAVSAKVPITNKKGDLDIGKTIAAGALTGATHPEKIPSYGGQIQEALPATHPIASGLAGTFLDWNIMGEAFKGLESGVGKAADIVQSPGFQSGLATAKYRVSKALGIPQETSLVPMSPEASDAAIRASRGNRAAAYSPTIYAEELAKRQNGELSPTEHAIAVEPSLTPDEKAYGAGALHQAINEGLGKAATDPRPTMQERLARVQEIEGINHDLNDPITGMIIRPAQTIPGEMAVESEQHKQALKNGENKPTLQDIHKQALDKAFQAIQVHRQTMTQNFKDFTPEKALDKTGADIINRHVALAESFKNTVSDPAMQEIQELSQAHDLSEDPGERIQYRSQIEKIQGSMVKAQKELEQKMYEFGTQVFQKSLAYATKQIELPKVEWSNFSKDLLNELSALDSHTPAYEQTIRQTVDGLVKIYRQKQLSKGQLKNPKLVYSRVIQLGGINPDSIKAAGYSVDEDFKQAGLGFLLRKSGMDFGKMASTIAGNKEIEGYKEGDSETEALMKALKSKSSITGKSKEPSLEKWELEQGEKMAQYKLAPVFFSSLEKAITDKMPNSATPDQIKGILANSGIPKEQLDWIDIEGFLSGKDVKDFKVKPPVKLYRGIAGEGAGTASLGNGLYSTPNKEFLKGFKFDKIVELSPDEAFPKNPLVLKANGNVPGAFSDWLLNESGESNIREFNKKWPDPSEFVKSKGYDGVIAGDEIVKYSVSNKISKQALLDYIRSNDVKVEEVVKGRSRANWVLKSGDRWWLENDNREPLASLTDTRKLGIGHWVVKDAKGQELDFANTKEEAQQIAEDHFGVGMGNKNATKFSSYQLPGGENYKELLLTLPEQNVVLPPKPDLITKLPEGYHLIHNHDGNPNVYPFGEWGILPPDQSHARGFTGRYYMTKEEATKAALEKLNYETVSAYDEASRKAREGKSFKSSHFDEPNVLAHIRFNDRTDADGKKVLFIEEVQSDWHQKGRKEGYQIKQDTEPIHDPDGMGDTERERIVESGVPNAPFKKTWHELALKRMLRYASENGYDKIAWTTGEQQAERYDLSKQVERISWNKHPDPMTNEKRPGAIYVAAHLKQGGTQSKMLMPNEIADFVGKDIAEKIVNGGAYGQLTGVDLKVGDQGMKGFYDQIIPSFLNKYTKKWGGRVVPSKIETALGTDLFMEKVGDKWEVMDRKQDNKTIGEYSTRENALEGIERLSKSGKIIDVHSLELTPSMKNSVLYEGQRYKLGKTPINKAVKVINEGKALINKLVPGVDHAIDENLKTEDGRDALGVFIKYGDKYGMIKTIPTAELTDYIHEVTHAGKALFLTAAERAKLEDEIHFFTGKTGEAMEEFIAEEGEKYYKSREEWIKKHSLWTQLKAFLKKLWRALNSFVTGTSKNDMSALHNFFDALYSGDLAERGIVTGGENEIMPALFKTKQAVETLKAVKDMAVHIGDAFLNILEPAKKIEVKLGEKAYTDVMRMIHTPDRMLQEFYNQDSKVLGKSFEAAEKWWERWSLTPERREALKNFNYARGFPASMEGMQIKTDALKKLPAELKDEKLMDSLKEVSDYVHEIANKNGVELRYMKDYFYGLYKNDPKEVDSFLKYWQTGSWARGKFDKSKTFPTIADAAGWGLELKHQNPVTNIRKELEAVSRVVGMRALRMELEKAPFAVDLEKNLGVFGSKKNLSDYKDWLTIHEPVFEGMKFAPEYAKFVNGMISKNLFQTVGFLRGLRNLTYGFQQIKFLGSLYHMQNMLRAALGEGRPQAFGKAFKALDKKDPIYLDYIQHGGGHKYSLEAQSTDQLKAGLEMLKKAPLGGAGKLLAEALKSKLILAGPGQTQWMFEEFIPALKFISYKMDLARDQQRMGRELTSAEKIKIIKDKHNFYGEMNERLFGRTGTVTSALRLLYNAPGYAEGNFRVVLKSFTDWSKKGNRSAQFVLGSLFASLMFCTIGTRVATGKWPERPKHLKDIRDLWKIRTNQVDGNGDPIYFEGMGYDKDYWTILGNLMTGQPGQIPQQVTRREQGMISTPFRILSDLSQIMRGSVVHDWKDDAIYNKTDTFAEKLSKFISYEVKEAAPISASTFGQTKEKGASIVKSYLTAAGGLRTTSSENVLYQKKLIGDFITLQGKAQKERVRLNKLYVENPAESEKQADSYNDAIQKKLDSINKELESRGLHAVDDTNADVKKLFIKSVHAPEKTISNRIRESVE